MDCVYNEEYNVKQNCCISNDYGLKKPTHLQTIGSLDIHKTSVSDETCYLNLSTLLTFGVLSLAITSLGRRKGLTDDQSDGSGKQRKLSRNKYRISNIKYRISKFPRLWVKEPHRSLRKPVGQKAQPLS